MKAYDSVANVECKDLVAFILEVSVTNTDILSILGTPVKSETGPSVRRPKRTVS